MSILVVGSTGMVGGDVARKLGQGVKALVRGGDAHRGAAELRSAGASVVEGDLTVPASLDRACQGVETVISTATTMPTGADDGLRRVDRGGTLALIDAAARQGVRRFVYVSYSGNIQEESALHRAKRDCEDRLMASPMQAVILRPSFFTEIWLGPHLGVDVTQGTARVYGPGDRRISWVSAFDVADFAVAATRNEYPEKNTLIEIGGPEPLSPLEAIQVIQEEAGTPLTVTHVPLEAIDQMHRSEDPVQRTIGGLMKAYAKGDEIPDAVATARRHGIELRSVADYARTLGKNA